MGYLIIAGVVLLGCSHICYLLRFQIRRWWRMTVVSRDLPPHQRWPEILQWQKGDHFEAHYPYEPFTLVSITNDGYAVVDWLGALRYVHLSHLVGYNASARTRRISRTLAQSNEYMELINAFNESVIELQKRDEKLKLVS